LPETFPGIGFDDSGVCNHCRQFVGARVKHEEDKVKFAHKFADLIEQVARQQPERQRSYDILMAYSGGKDSSYTLSLLRTKYGLRVLAVSFDNGFLSPRAIENIQIMTDVLGIDHVLFKPRWDLLKKVFATATEKELYPKKTLERASTICTSCIGLVKAVCLKLAIELDIPMVGYGWSPGQAPVQSSIMRNNPALVKMSQQAMMHPLREVAGEEILEYFLKERHYADPGRFPWNVHPMAWEFYEEQMVVEEIAKLGWVAPSDTDTNSTNCLLNAYANHIHNARYGFHPYVWEIANMVRYGVMPRDEGMTKIYCGENQAQIDFAKRKLL
jgi:predicted PP-loop superfamily ATPase